MAEYENEENPVDIVQYFQEILDSEYTTPLYRSRMVVLGSEDQGKTSLLHAIFPLRSNFLLTNTKLGQREYFFVLQGTQLKIYENEKESENPLNIPKKTVLLTTGSFSVYRGDNKKNGLFGLILSPLPKKRSDKDVIQAYTRDKNERDHWWKRIKKLVEKQEKNEGIIVDEMLLEDPVPQGGQHRKPLEINTWEFSNSLSHLFYQHKFFLPNDAFLIVWDITKWEEVWNYKFFT